MAVDLTPYAGRWVALFADEVAGVGFTAEEAAHLARHNRPRDKFIIRYVEPPGGEPLALPPLLDEIRPLLAQATQPVYLVGGAVRDALLGRPSQDLDFVVPAEAIKLAFQVADALKVPAYVLDKERDAGRVVLPTAQTYLDFTRFRGPDLEADLRDRDFTLNALALPATAQTDAALIDPTGGQADLQKRIIRQVDEHAIQNDPVRALRALRLAHRLSCHLAPETETAVAAAAPLLTQSSSERIRDEFMKLLACDRPDEVVAQMDTLGILAVVLPEITALHGVQQSTPHHEDVFNHTVSVLRRLVLLEAFFDQEAPLDEPALVATAYEQLGRYRAQLQAHWQQTYDGGVDGRLLLRLGALFHDVGKKDTQTIAADGRIRFFKHDKVGATLAVKRLSRLAFSKQAAGQVGVLVAHHMRPLLLSQGERPLSRRAVFRYYKATGTAGLDICILTLADHLATYAGPGPAEKWAAQVAVVSQLLDQYFGHHEETVAPPLLVNGRDLMRTFHLKQGPEVGRLLRLVEEAQAAGEISTIDDAYDLVRRSLS